MTNSEINKERYGKRVNIFKEIRFSAAIILGFWTSSFGIYFYANAAMQEKIYNPIKAFGYYADLAKNNLAAQKETRERNRKSNSLEGTVGDKINIGEF